MAKAYNTTAKTPEEIKIVVKELLSNITLEEKVGQMTQSPGSLVDVLVLKWFKIHLRYQSKKEKLVHKSSLNMLTR